jgi:hypothetical protein
MSQEKFTVIACDEQSGQIVCHHVMATDGMNAFACVATANQGKSLSLVVSMPGWLEENEKGLTFPGEGLVSVETVLEQPEVFGAHGMSASDVEAQTREMESSNNTCSPPQPST